MEYEIEVGNHWFRVIDKNNRKNQIMVRGFIEYSKKNYPPLRFDGIPRWHVQGERFGSSELALERAKELLAKKTVMKKLFYKIRAKHRTKNVENDVVEGYEVYSTSVDDEGIIACFFSSEIYGTEEAYKKASEAKEELSSWQDERRADNA